MVEERFGEEIPVAGSAAKIVQANKIRAGNTIAEELHSNTGNSPGTGEVDRVPQSDQSGFLARGEDTLEIFLKKIQRSITSRRSSLLKQTTEDKVDEGSGHFYQFLARGVEDPFGDFQRSQLSNLDDVYGLMIPYL